MAFFSYPGANATVQRHWPYFQRQEADWVYGIGTIDGKCEWPEGVHPLDVGEDRYIDGTHLPRRLLDTIEILLLRPWRVLALLEYDVVIFKSMPFDRVETSAAHFAGGQTWGSQARWFAHCPWVFARDTAIRFLKAGREALAEGIVPERASGNPSVPEASPDCFYGYVMDRAGIPFQRDMWQEYSRNSFDVPGHLEEARQAYRDGVSCIHGIKTQEQLDFILS